ncbi:MAG: ribosomal protein S18-alanine N-acetyltransferase [Acidobacteriaceae bacterium]|nr:ribosomal protein S18-alanine N-acetyltransferase [Acidobacteriaceae bacterium]
MSVEIREASILDLPAIEGIAGITAEAPQWSARIWERILQEPAAGRFVLLATSDGEILGFAVCMLIAGVAEIESIAVAGTHRRLGIGRKLLLAMMERVRSAAAEAIELEVRESNATAQAFYRTLGFIESGKRRGYYEHPREDAVMMTLEL